MTGSDIWKLREQLGLSQSDLGKKIGASQAQISQWEREISSPSDDKLEMLQALVKEAGPLEGQLLVAEEISGARSKKTRKKSAKEASNGAALGFEAELWKTADLLRNNVDPAEYKHVVLGLIFLKYVSDSFEAHRDHLRAAVADPNSELYVDDVTRRETELQYILEDRDEYTAANVFWIPKNSRWDDLQAAANLDDIGKRLDDAMEAIEKENLSLKGVLPKIYARPNYSRDSLAKLINVIGGIGLGDKEAKARDTLGRVYQYFLSRFASAEGKGGGEFYTPQSIVRVLVEMIEPYHGRVYDPCCGSGGMFVQSAKFVEAHDGKRNDISIFGQESNLTTWRLAKMNLAIRGIESNLGGHQADTFHKDLHPDLKADFILANPPFNISEWGGDRVRDDVRWKFGTPPAGNANFAWVQHFIHHLSPNGTAGFVLANGSMSSMSGGEGDIRKEIVEADLVDCIVACPGQLFYATQIPVCLWFLTRNKTEKGFRDRRGETLFIDARAMGRLETRVLRVFDDDDIRRIADTYHAWRGEKDAGDYADVAGFCKSATTEEIRSHDHVLTPGRYVGAAEVEDDGEPFEEKMQRLADELQKQTAEAAELDAAILKNLEVLGFGK